VRALVPLLAVLLTAAAQAPSRQVAITFDDLPIAGVLRRDDAASRELTTKLLRAIGEHKVPVVGFVNEDKLLARDGSQNTERVALLRRWLDGGLELGNHGYSHRDFNETPLDVFEADVLKGESVIRPLMKEHGQTPRFFRHPFLHTGRGGITWLHRWALTRKMPKAFFAGEPETPQFVAEQARPD